MLDSPIIVVIVIVCALVGVPGVMLGTWLARNPHLAVANKLRRSVESNLEQKSTKPALAAYRELRELTRDYVRETVPLDNWLIAARILLRHLEDRERWKQRRGQSVGLDDEERALFAQVSEDVLRPLEGAGTRAIAIYLTAQVIAAVVAVAVRIGDLARGRAAFAALIALRDHCPRCNEVYSLSARFDAPHLGPLI